MDLKEALVELGLPHGRGDSKPTSRPGEDFIRFDTFMEWYNDIMGIGNGPIPDRNSVKKDALIHSLSDRSRVESLPRVWLFDNLSTTSQNIGNCDKINCKKVKYLR